MIFVGVYSVKAFSHTYGVIKKLSLVKNVFQRRHLNEMGNKSMR